MKRSVIRQLHTKRKEVLVGAAVGEDCAAVELAEDEMFVISTDPITGTAPGYREAGDSGYHERPGERRSRTGRSHADGSASGEV